MFQFTPVYLGLGALADDYCGNGPHIPLPRPGTVTFTGGVLPFNAQMGTEAYSGRAG